MLTETKKFRAVKSGFFAKYPLPWKFAIAPNGQILDVLSADGVRIHLRYIDMIELADGVNEMHRQLQDRKEVV